MKQKRVKCDLVSNSKDIDLNESITASKMRISYCRYITGSSGNRTVYISVERFDKNPIKSSVINLSSYSRVLPLFSGTALDLAYMNDDSASFDVVLDKPVTFQQFTVKAFINGNMSNTDITNLNPMEFEIYFEE